MNVPREVSTSAVTVAGARADQLGRDGSSNTVLRWAGYCAAAERPSVSMRLTMIVRRIMGMASVVFILTSRCTRQYL